MGANNTEEVNDFIAANVTSHITYDNSVQFLCSPCGKLYKGMHSVRDHVSVHHVNVGRRYGCPMCEGIFANKNSLRNHISKNHSELVRTGLDYEQFLLVGDDDSSKAAKAVPEAVKEASKVISVTRVGRKSKDKGQKEDTNVSTTEKQGSPLSKDIQGSPTETEEAPLTNTNAATKAPIKRNTQESLGSRQDPKGKVNKEFLNSNITERNGIFYCNPCGKAYKSHGGIKSHIFQKHLDLVRTGVDNR